MTGKQYNIAYIMIHGAALALIKKKKKNIPGAYSNYICIIILCKVVV